MKLNPLILCSTLMATAFPMVVTAAEAHGPQEDQLHAGIEVELSAAVRPAMDAFLTHNTRGVPPIQASLIVQDGDMPSGLTAPISTLNAPFIDGTGRVGFVGRANDQVSIDDHFIWYGSGVQFVDSSVVGQTLTGGESTMGIGDAGQFIYSPSVDGADSVWTHNGLLHSENTQAPGFPAGTNTTFHSRPTMNPAGASFWVSGFNESAGTTTEGRILYTSPDSTPGATTVVLRSDDVIGGLTIDRPSGIDFDYAFSNDANHLIAVLLFDTGSTIDDGGLYVDGAVVARENQPNGTGDDWDNFDNVDINNSGNYVFSGDTNGSTDSDEFIAYNGDIIMREGDTVGGVALTTSARVDGLSINSSNQFIHLWNVGGGGSEVLLLTCEPDSVDITTFPVLAIGDELDFDNDGMADAVVTDFNASGSVGPGLSLGENGQIHVELDINYGAGDVEAIVRLGLPPCPSDLIFADDFESP